MVKKLLREPLVHFLLLGALLFLVAGRQGDGGDLSRRVEVTPERVAQLRAIFARTWQRPPTETELNGLVEDFVKEEIYAREARAMGLDRDDTVIRRRLRQKLEFLTEDAGSAAPPTEEELQAYLDEHPKDYRIPPRLALEQVYFSVDRRGEEGAREASAALLERLRSGAADVEPREAGDRLLLGLPDRPSTPFEWARILGEGFGESLPDLPVGEWTGPVRSGFGLHLVRVTEKVEGRDPRLEEVLPAVERDLLAERRRQAADDFYRAARERYDVVVPEGFGEAPDTASETPASETAASERGDQE